MSTPLALDVAIGTARSVGKRIVGRSAGGSTRSADYCLSVWLEHRRRIQEAGLPLPRRLAELGPGDSVGVGIAALLTGVDSVVALDIEAYRPLDSPRMLADLEAIVAREGGPPLPRLPELRAAAAAGTIVRYVAPWTDASVVEPGSVDAVISQAVLEHVDDVEATFRAMAGWLAPGGVISHQVDLRSHRTSLEWNGHWRYPDRLWPFVRPRRGGMNRQPASTYVAAATAAGFRIIDEQTRAYPGGIAGDELAPEWRWLDESDRTTGELYLLAVKDDG